MPDMKRLEILFKLKELQQSGDKEVAHNEADKLLCEFLTSIGYGDISEEFELIEKWYA